MRYRYVPVVGVVAILSVLVCSAVAVAGDQEDMAAIAKVREMEAANVNDATSASVEDVYAKDVKSFPPNEPTLEGLEAVQDWHEALVEGFDVSLEYTHADVTIRGDMAFEHYGGVAKLTPKAGGETMTQNVRGIHIYKKGEDGSWKIIYDMWNSDTPGH